jgi:electron transfer flavoprotein alpha subunit
MAGIWIFAENQVQTLELLNIGGLLAAKMGTTVSALLPGNAEGARDYLAHGADEVLLLSPLAGDQSLEAYLPVMAEAAKNADPDVFLFAGTVHPRNWPPVWRPAWRRDSAAVA